ncbi:helix-turn-helix domain-containing protein [Microbacterium hominis]|uniref:helix-turn-helix domain-containing protein n=1 Tax=Microbacterium hominis TaxID=162426 RepID=UPI003B010063
MAAAGPGRRSDGRRNLPRKARQLTDDEKMAFVEDYRQGEPIADLATKLGVHRTTLDNLVKRLELSREDPDAVPPAVKDAIVASYRAGDTLATIGGWQGFSPNKVQRLLVAVGEPIRSRGPQGSQLTSEQVRELVDRYELGWAMGSMAEGIRRELRLRAQATPACWCAASAPGRGPVGHEFRCSQSTLCLAEASSARASLSKLTSGRASASTRTM